MSAATILRPAARVGSQAGGALCFTGGPTTSTALPKTEQQVHVRFLDTAVPEKALSVWLLNDSRNRKDRVSAVLEKLAGLDPNEADAVMMQAHSQGAGRIAVLPEVEATLGAAKFQQLVQEPIPGKHRSIFACLKAHQDCFGPLPAASP